MLNAADRFCAAESLGALKAEDMSESLREGQSETEGAKLTLGAADRFGAEKRSARYTRLR